MGVCIWYGMVLRSTGLVLKSAVVLGGKERSVRDEWYRVGRCMYTVWYGIEEYWGGKMFTGIEMWY